MAKKSSTQRRRAQAQREIGTPRRLRATQLAPPREDSPAQTKRELRAVLQASAENLAIDVENWIRRGARQNPLAAVSAFASLAEYCLPRLARVEQLQKQIPMSKEDVERQLRELGIDPAQVWDKVE